MKFGRLLHESFKSEDTEEKVDMYFNRPVGLAVALLCARLHIHPNTVTITSIVIGMGAGCMFYFHDIEHNATGVALLVLANFCDSADGQLARLTGQKTLKGRILDGFAGDLWFAAIYIAIILRLYSQPIPFTHTDWGVLAFILCFVAGVLCHSRQSSLADYYRQIHLYCLYGKKGSELDNSVTQQAIYATLPKRGKWLERLFYRNYARYCRSQEERTPAFQAFYRDVRTTFPDGMPQELRDEFRAGSLPLMKYANLLTFNARSFVLYISCLTDCPYIFPLTEITIFSVIYIYMRHKHEALCARLNGKVRTLTGNRPGKGCITTTNPRDGK